MNLLNVFYLTIGEIFDYIHIGLITFDTECYTEKQAKRFYEKIRNNKTIIFYCDKIQIAQSTRIVLIDSDELFSFWNFYMGKLNIEHKKTHKITNWENLNLQKRKEILDFQVSLIQKL